MMPAAPRSRTIVPEPETSSRCFAIRRPGSFRSRSPRLPRPDCLMGGHARAESSLPRPLIAPEQALVPERALVPEQPGYLARLLRQRRGKPGETSFVSLRALFSWRREHVGWFGNGSSVLSRIGSTEVYTGVVVHD